MVLQFNIMMIMTFYQMLGNCLIKILDFELLMQTTDKTLRKMK